MIVIGLTGLAGAGKDTVADHLVDVYGFTKLSFAADLKSMLDTLNPYVDEGIRLMDVRREAGRAAESVLKAHYPEYRRLLQTLGTECVRARDSVFWINRLLVKVEATEGNVVVTDCRFPNEVEALTASAFGLTDFWHVVRPSLAKGPASHSSESYAGLMGEVSVINSGTIADLQARADVRLAELLGGIRG